MYLLTHSLSPVLVPVAVMDPKVLKTKISHTHSLILSHSGLTLLRVANFALLCHNLAVCSASVYAPRTTNNKRVSLRCGL